MPAVQAFLAACMIMDRDALLTWAQLVPPILASYQPAPIDTGTSSTTGGIDASINTGTDASGVDTGSAKPTPEPSTKPEPTPPSTRAKRHLPQPRPPGRLFLRAYQEATRPGRLPRGLDANASDTEKSSNASIPALPKEKAMSAPDGDDASGDASDTEKSSNASIPALPKGKALMSAPDGDDASGDSECTKIRNKWRAKQRKIQQDLQVANLALAPYEHLLV